MRTKIVDGESLSHVIVPGLIIHRWVFWQEGVSSVTDLYLEPSRRGEGYLIRISLPRSNFNEPQVRGFQAKGLLCLVSSEPPIDWIGLKINGVSNSFKEQGRGGLVFGEWLTGSLMDYLDWRDAQRSWSNDQKLEELVRSLTQTVASWPGEKRLILKSAPSKEFPKLFDCELVG